MSKKLIIYMFYLLNLFIHIISLFFIFYFLFRKLHSIIVNILINKSL